MSYNDYTSSFEQLVKQGDTTNIHQQNQKTLATEMYKISQYLSVPSVIELFTEKEVI